MLYDYKLIKLLLFIILLYFSYTDIRYKEINMYISISIYIIIIFSYFYIYLIENNLNYKALLFSIIISIFFFLFSKFTNESLGYGDAYILSILSACMEVRFFLLFISILIFFVGIISMFIIFISILRKKYIKNRSLPLIPFVLIVMIFMEWKSIL